MAYIMGSATSVSRRMQFLSPLLMYLSLSITMFVALLIVVIIAAVLKYMKWLNTIAIILIVVAIILILLFV